MFVYDILDREIIRYLFDTVWSGMDVYLIVCTSMLYRLQYDFIYKVLCECNIYVRNTITIIKYYYMYMSDIITNLFLETPAITNKQGLQIIQTDIEQLNNLTNGSYQELLNDYVSTTNIGKIIGGSKLTADDYPIEKVYRNIKICHKSYYTYRVGDIIEYTNHYTQSIEKYKVISEINIVTHYLTAVRGYIIRRETDDAIEYGIIIRGTAGFFQIITDLMIISSDTSLTIDNNPFTINMTYGIYDSLFNSWSTEGIATVDYIFSQLSDIVSKDTSGKQKHLIFHGHSLGGCQSAILACFYFSDKYQTKYPKISKDTFQTIELYTIGEPKPSRKIGLRYAYSYLLNNYNKFRYYNTVNDQDIISYIITPVIPTFHSSPYLYVYETKSNAIYKVQSSLMSFGIFSRLIYTLIMNSYAIIPRILIRPQIIYYNIKIVMNMFIFVMQYHLPPSYEKNMRHVDI